MNYSNDRQPRVLIVGSNKEFGGSLVSVCHTLCQGLVESNYEVFLLQPEGTLTNELGEVNISSDQINDITQLTISGWPSYLSQLMHHSDFKEGNQLFTEILKFVDPDIVHFHHTATFGSEIINIAKQQHCFVTVWLHDYWYFCPLMARVKSNGQSCNGSGEHCFECSCKQFTGLAENWKSRQQQSIKILNQCDRVIAVSQSIQSDAIRYGVDRHKITTIQPAVQSIDHLWDQLDYLQRPINESLLNFAFIGNLHSHKGIDVLFDALKLLQCKESQSIICHIHGTGEDAYVEQLKSSAETIYQTMIVFEGAYNANDDLPKILLETDLVILPSIKPESYGLIIEEVLAAKVPVICSQIGGFKEHFFNGVQGLLFEPNNVQALVNCLQSVVDNPLQLSAWQRNIRRPRLTQDFITEFDNLFRQLNQLSVIAPNKGSAESAKLLISPSNSSKTEQHYQSWRHFQQLNDADTLIMQQRMQQHWNQHPRFHLFLVMQVGDEKHLASTIESLANQFYKNFKLTVFSLLPCPDPVFDDMDSLQWQQLNEIDATQVSRFVMESTMDWIGLIESGDQLAQQSLFSLAEHINHQTNWQMVYTDHDLTNGQQFFHPQFKADFNLEWFLCYPYTNGFCLFTLDLFKKLNGFNVLEEANYHLILQVTEQYSEEIIGHIPELLFHRYHEKEAIQNQKNATSSRIQGIQSYLDRQQLQAHITEGDIQGSHFVQLKVKSTPSVGIIIVTQNNNAQVKQCLSSLFQQTRYPNFEVTVVNIGEMDLFNDVIFQSSEQKHIHCINYPASFSPSKAINCAAKLINSEYLLLLHDDIEITQSNWLTLLIAFFNKHQTGIVSPRLVDRKNIIQHGGMILGLSDSANYFNSKVSLNDASYMNRAHLNQNFSAVSAACLLVKNTIFHQVGGFDDVEFPHLFADVDFCLKVKCQALNVIWTPTVTLRHHGAKDIAETNNVKRDDLAKQGRQFLHHHINDCANDFAYNKNLSFINQDASINLWLNVKWPTFPSNRPKIMGITLDPWGCAEWRMAMPLRVLDKSSSAHIKFLQHGGEDDRIIQAPYATDIIRSNPDVLYMQTYIHDMHLEMIELYKKHCNTRLVYTLDDNLFELPEKNPTSNLVYPDIDERIEKVVNFCDRLIVSTEPLVDVYKGLIDDIVVLPNYLEKTIWAPLTSKRRQGKKPRVGWAGAQQHQGDLELLIPIIEATKDEVEWVFFGMYLLEFKHYIKELHDGVIIEQYPKKLASLNLDLAIAPLEINSFNESKSNLRILEYGNMGWPVICTDIIPYQNAPVTRLPNQPDLWIKTIRDYIHELDHLEKQGDQLQQWVRKNWMLDDHVDEWLKALLSDAQYRQYFN